MKVCSDRKLGKDQPSFGAVSFRHRGCIYLPAAKLINFDAVLKLTFSRPISVD